MMPVMLLVVMVVEPVTGVCIPILKQSATPEALFPHPKDEHNQSLS